MARLTYDAVAIQSVVGPGETVNVTEAARRAFSPEEIGVSAIAIMRARRACNILYSRGIVEFTDENHSVIRSVDRTGSSAYQLTAAFARAVIASPMEEDSDAEV